jgi:hypothetical protein
MKASSLALALALLLAMPQHLFTQEAKPITAWEAKDHIGESATVCGKVVETRYLPSRPGNPTFLSLEEATPNPIFTIVIWGSDRSTKFGSADAAYKDTTLCVSGTISNSSGMPEIVARNPEQIKVKRRAKDCD